MKEKHMKNNKIERVASYALFTSDGAEYRINQPIPLVEGTMGDISPEKPYGRGIIRNAVLDGKIKLNIVDKQEFNESYNGKIVIITGAVLVEDNYKGKRLALKLNGNAKIECVESSPTNGQRTIGRKESETLQENDIRLKGHILAEESSLFRDAWEEAKRLKEELGLSDYHFERLSSTFYIQMSNRLRGGNTDNGGCHE
jgi:hypothetical protein